MINKDIKLVNKKRLVGNLEHLRRKMCVAPTSVGSLLLVSTHRHRLRCILRLRCGGTLKDALERRLRG